LLAAWVALATPVLFRAQAAPDPSISARPFRGSSVSPPCLALLTWLLRYALFVAGVIFGRAWPRFFGV